MPVMRRAPAGATPGMDRRVRISPSFILVPHRLARRGRWLSMSKSGEIGYGAGDVQI
jgi:hypothetical protein